MIQLANQATASRTGFRPEQDGDEGKGQSTGVLRSRSGHAWPFPSRYAARPVRPDSQKPTASDSGS